VRRKPRERVMRILPYRLSDDEGSVRIKMAEDFHARLLRIDEAVAFRAIDGVRTLDFPALGDEGLGKDRFHLLLRGPADAVGAEAQVAAGDEIGVAGFELGRVHGVSGLCERCAASSRYFA